MPRKFVNEHPGGEMPVLEAMRLAHGVDGTENALPILGMKATGWVAQVFGDVRNSTATPRRGEQPDLFRAFTASLPAHGLSWLSFLDRFGLGACLADDMGLGKTIQLIALLQHERQNAADPSMIGPTLLVVPMSVLGNWKRELGDSLRNSRSTYSTDSDDPWERTSSQLVAEKRRHRHHLLPGDARPGDAGGDRVVARHPR